MSCSTIPARSSSSRTTKSSSRSSSSKRSTPSRRRRRSAGATRARWRGCSTACGRTARLSDGVPLPEGGRVRVASAARSVPTTLRESQIADHLILMVALDVRDAAKGESTIFVTKDVNLRIRADALGLTSMDFEAERIDIDELYSGMTEMPITGRRRRRVLRAGHAAADRDRPEGEPVRAAARPRQSRRTARSAASTAPGRSWCRCASCATASGASARATRSSTTRSICCCTTTSSWSRWSARRAPARRCSRSRPGCRRWSRSSCTRSCSCRGRSFRSGATSATCPATSRRS